MRTLSIDLRPTKFSEVIGQEPVVSAIQKKLASGTVPIAWMFSGPPGVGKTTLARILATELESTATEINASDTNGVDEIRALAQSSRIRPLSGKYKVLVLDEAQRLTEAAQNVLLKPLEDANSPTVWIFCTTEPKKIIKPLQDRCLRFELKALTDDQRIDLIKRALAAVSFSGDTKAIFETIDYGEIRSPREILMAVERFAAGMPAEQAVLEVESDAQYFEVAKAIPDWGKVRGMLKNFKSTDVRGLRAVVAAYLKSCLLGQPIGPKADAYSDCLFGLIQLATFEDGVQWSGTVAALYRCCKKLSA